MTPGEAFCDRQGHGHRGRRSAIDRGTDTPGKAFLNRGTAVALIGQNITDFSTMVLLLFFFFLPSHAFSSPFLVLLPRSRNSDWGNNSKIFFSRLHTTVRTCFGVFIARIIQHFLLPLVNSRRIVPTHATMGPLDSWCVMIYIVATFLGCGVGIHRLSRFRCLSRKKMVLDFGRDVADLLNKRKTRITIPQKKRGVPLPQQHSEPKY